MAQPFDEANVNLLQGRRIAWLEIELSILASLADLLDARRPLDEILGELGNRCLDGSGLSSGALFLFDPEGKLHHTATLGSPPGPFLDAEWVALLIATLGPEASPVALSQPFTIEQLASVLNQSAEQSIVLAPLRSAAQTVGYLVLGTTQAPLDDDWIAFAGAIASHLSSAIGQAEARSHLEESEALHRAVVENLAEGVTVIVDGLRVVVNEAYLTILGLEKKSDAEGLPATGWVVPADKARVESIFTRVLEGEEVAPYEARVRGGDGEERLLVVSTKRISYGGQSAALSLLYDITDQRHDQEAVAQSAIDYRHSEEMLRQAQKMEAVGNLAGGIAHDFNNLLTAIIGFGQMGLAEAVEGDVRTYLEEVVSAGERAATLTRQLLAFSRRQVMHLEIIDVNTVVTDMGRLLSRIIGENIQLEILLDPGDTSVRADPGQIEQVVLNLAVNARAAMGLGAVLTIQTHNVELDAERAALYGVKPGPYVQLSVTDTGVGIPEGDLAQIFEPFFTTKPQGEGTGMGLATVYGIVKQSEGHIAVYSEVGVGTTFNIYLPRAEAVPAARAGAEPAAVTFRGDETILLVEDEAGVRELSLAVLEGAGYTVLAAARPEAALDALAHHVGHIELLLTDVVMPGMNGPTLAAQVAQLRPDMKVLFMSGYPGDALQRQGTLQNDAAYIDKPFRPRALAEKVREVLDGRATAAESAPAA